MQLSEQKGEQHMQVNHVREPERGNQRISGAYMQWGANEWVHKSTKRQWAREADIETRANENGKLPKGRHSTQTNPEPEPDAEPPPQQSSFSTGSSTSWGCASSRQNASSSDSCGYIKAGDGERDGDEGSGELGQDSTSGEDSRALMSIGERARRRREERVYADT